MYFISYDFYVLQSLQMFFLILGPYITNVTYHFFQRNVEITSSMNTFTYVKFNRIINQNRAKLLSVKSYVPVTAEVKFMR